MDLLPYARYVEAVRSEGDAFANAVRAAGPGAVVPSCGEWTVADLCSHVGRLHRWVTHVLQNRPEPPGEHWKQLSTPEGDALVEYGATGFGPMADALAAASSSDACWSWTDRHDVGFWARRQAHELAVHRYDAQLAAGAPQPIERELAVDGIRELFDILPYRPGGPPSGNGETIHLHCTDGEGEWLVQLTPDGPTVTNEHAKGDVAARGGASDLLLMMWGRVPVSSDALQVFGDASLLERWSDGKL